MNYKNNNISNRFRKVIALLTAIAVLLSIFTFLENMHVHQLEDGTVVMHSHILPFTANDTSTPAGGNNHTHTKHEYSLLQIISSVFMALILVLIIFKITTSVSIHNKNNSVYSLQKISLSALTFRGPPAYSL